MSRIYVRSDRIKDVVFNVKLHIPEWKVLFAVDGQKDSNSLASFLELPESDVHTTLDKLQEMQLVSAVEIATEPQPETPLTDTPESIEISETPEMPEVAQEPATEDVSDLLETLEEPETSQPTETIQEEEVAEQSPAPEFDAETDFLSESAEAVEELSIEEEDAGQQSPAVTEEAQEEEAPEVSETPPTDEEGFDQLIGNLLEEGLEEEETAEAAGMSAATLEEAVEEAETELEEGKEDDFDLDSIFQEEMTETETSLEDMLEMSDVQVASEEEEGVAAPPKEAAPEKGEPSGTILIVDDSVVIRKMVEIALENESFNIISVATGKDALNYLDENTPDLIILDIMLTDMNGLDVLKAIKASKKEIPVVMLSAKDTPRETTKAKQLGADDFIPKPFKDEELVAKIKELVKN